MLWGPMHTKILGMILALAGPALAGCRNETSAPLPQGNEIANLQTEPLPEADVNASLEDLNQPPSSESAGAPRFVGRWAVEERLCPTTAWRFTESELNTPAGSVCRFTDVREVPGGYDVRARCTAEGPETDDVLELRFAESAGGMLFGSNVIADAGLVRCESD